MFVHIFFFFFFLPYNRSWTLLNVTGRGSINIARPFCRYHFRLREAELQARVCNTLTQKLKPLLQVFQQYQVHVTVRIAISWFLLQLLSPYDFYFYDSWHFTPWKISDSEKRIGIRIAFFICTPTNGLLSLCNVQRMFFYSLDEICQRGIGNAL